ncbi:MAG: hypothetical protein GY679_03725 [Mycoplasma sp.]|nr:hypothetical protein [Mycoplasma sp.]
MKKKVLKSFGLFGVGAITTSAVVSCGSMMSSDSEGNIATVLHKNKKIKDSGVKLKGVLENIKESDVQKTKEITNVFNAAVKYLYKQEQKWSEKDKKFREMYIRYQNYSFEEKKIKEKIKAANIKALDNEEKIKKRVTASFLDAKDAFKNKVGTKWGEEAWGTELAKSYNGSKSDEEAINNLIIKEMKSNAYIRYTMLKTTTKYTKGELELGKLTETQIKNLSSSGDGRDKLKAQMAPYFVWLAKLDKEGFVSSSNKNRTLRQLTEGDYITIISTNSFVPEFKSPAEIIGGDKTTSGTKNGHNNGYLNKFDPMYISHFLIKAIPDAKNRLSPWKIDMPDLKKLLYSTDGKNSISTQLDQFKGVFKDNNNSKEEWKVNKEDENMLKLVSANGPGSKLSGGSLGLQDELKYVNEMDPGFSIAILNKDSTGATLFEENKKDPIEGLSERLIWKLEQMNGGKSPDGTSIGDFPSVVSDAASAISKRAALAANSQNQTASAIEWQEYVDGLISTQSEKDVLANMGRVFRDIFGSPATKYRSAVYLGKGDNKITLSNNGVHIMAIHKLEEKDALKNIKTMIASDVQRSKEGKTPFFKAIEEINKYSSDQFLIVKALMKEEAFKKFLGTQKNYSAEPKGNKFPNYNVASGSKDLANIIKALKSYEDIFNENRAYDSIQKIRTNIQNSYFKNELIKLKDENKWVQNISKIYDNALDVAKEGLVK